MREKKWIYKRIFFFFFDIHTPRAEFSHMIGEQTHEVRWVLIVVGKLDDVDVTVFFFRRSFQVMVELLQQDVFGFFVRSEVLPLEFLHGENKKN